MSSWIKRCCLCVAVVGLLAGPGLAQDATLSIELIEVNGVDVPGAPVSSASSPTIAQGDILTVEIFIRDWSPGGQELRGYQVQIDQDGYTSGTLGNIRPQDWDSTTDFNTCTVADGLTNKDNAYIDVDHCNGEEVPIRDPSGSDVGVWGVGNPCTLDNCFAGDNSCNASEITFDWLHGSPIELFNVNTYADSTRCDYRYGEALDQGITGPVTGDKLYAGTVILEVSADADGTFTLCLDSADTILVDETGADIPVLAHECLTLTLGGELCFANSDCDVADECTRAVCDKGTNTCINHPRWYGDANHNGARNVADVVCVARVTFQDATDCSGWPTETNDLELDYGPNDAGCGNNSLNIVDVVQAARGIFQDIDDACCGVSSDLLCSEVTGGAPHCQQ